jgi:hypothetical protein
MTIQSWQNDDSVMAKYGKMTFQSFISRTLTSLTFETGSAHSKTSIKSSFHLHGVAVEVLSSNLLPQEGDLSNRVVVKQTYFFMLKIEVKQVA